jgi:hypothetical protein
MAGRHSHSQALHNASVLASEDSRWYQLSWLRMLMMGRKFTGRHSIGQPVFGK